MKLHKTVDHTTTQVHNMFECMISQSKVHVAKLAY
jgi:hypothetical protein